MGLFTAEDLAELRAFNTETNADVCVINRHAARSLDSSTLVDSAGSATEIYNGPCQLKESDTASLQIIGEGQVALQMIDVYIDWDAARIRRGDILTVTSSGHSWLVGRDMVVLDQRVQTQPRGRKLTCELMEASASNDPS